MKDENDNVVQFPGMPPLVRQPSELDADAEEQIPTIKIVPSPSEPTKVARRLIEHAYTSSKGELRILRWRGDIYTYRAGCWHMRSADVIRAGIYRWLEHAHYKDAEGKQRAWAPNTTKVNQVIDALGALVLVDEHYEPPMWLESGYDTGRLLPVANGLLEIESRKLWGQTRDHFNITQLPFRYRARASYADWEQYLKTIWPDDVDSIRCLQEIFGYVVSGRTDMEKLFLLTGPTRSGKGTVASALAALVGPEYVVSPTLRSLGGNFGLAPLIGKNLAVIGDARLDARDAGAAVENLLGISGQDAVNADRKNRSVWTGRLPTRFVILSNEVPHFMDASGTIASRFVNLAFQKSWLGREDKSIKPKFSSPEAGPALLNWALDGYDRLMAAGEFTVPESGRRVMEQLQDLASPYPAFVRECCELGPELWCYKDDMYQEWKYWAGEHGYKAGNEAWFSRGLFASYPDLSAGRVRTDDGAKRRPVYWGIKCKASGKVVRISEDA